MNLLISRIFTGQKKNYKVLLLLYFSFIFLSLPFEYILAIDNFVNILMLIVALFLLHFIRYNFFNKYFLNVFLLLIGLSTIYTIAWNNNELASNIKLILQPLVLILSIDLCLLVSKKDINYFVTLSTNILLLFLFGAWLAFFYRAFGGPSLLQLQYEGTTYDFFLSSFVKNYWGQPFIRPAAIFDEPGTFSFIICFIAILRKSLSRNKTVTWILLLLGFVTFSLAHFIFTIFYLLSEKNIKILKYLLILALIFISLISISNEFQEGFERLFLYRFELVDGDNTKLIAGDNRSSHFINAYKQLNLDSFIWGVDPICVLDKNKSIKLYGNMGENPLWPLMSRGILVAWPYYFIIFVYLIIGIKKKRNFLYIGFALLLMQRPYILDIGYALMASLPLYVFYKNKINIKNEYRI